jgi:hypothetical protein
MRWLYYIAWLLLTIVSPIEAWCETPLNLAIPKVYSSTGNWVVGSNGDGACLAASEVAPGLEAWIGISAQGESLLGFFNNDWASLENGKTYKITQELGRGVKWQGDYVAVERTNSTGERFRGVLQVGLSSEFLNELAKSGSLTLTYEDKHVASISLKGGRAVLTELQNCRTALANLATRQEPVGQAPMNAPGSDTARGTQSEPKEPTQKAARPVSVSEKDQGRRVALIIGNSAYKNVPALPNPANDASVIAKTLRAVGFDQVIEAKDVTQEGLLASLKQFARLADGSSWAVIYYSGHGIEVGGKNYIIPIDAQMKTDRDAELEAVDIVKLQTAADGAKKLKLIVLDACRDNPFASQMRRTVATRSLSRGLSQVEPEGGTLIVYAAKHGEIALDGDGHNSPFAEAFINRIKTPDLEVRMLFDSVRDDVLDATQGKQQPYVYGSLSAKEKFYFVRGD